MITAIVTVFFPKESNVINIQKISEQVDRVIICDNTPYYNKILKNVSKNCIYKAFCRNLGLSQAFNTVLRDSTFNWLNDEYIIFFDQDSQIEEEHIEILVRNFQKIEECEQIGVLGPVFYNQSNGEIEVPRMKKKIFKNIFKVSSIITSSMLTKYKILKNIGFWNDEIFLDMADWDICWRLKVNGYECFLTNDIIMKHCLGIGEKKIIFMKIRVGSPFREYYQIRDSQYLLKKDYVPLKYKIRFWMMLTIRSIIHIIFLEKSKERIYYIKLGYKDFRENRHGELTENKLYKKRINSKC